MLISNTTTLVVTYAATAVSTALIAARLICWRVGRLRSASPRIPDSVWMALALALLLTRLPAVHISVVDGNNNVSDPTSLAPADVAARELGSKMVLLTRLCFVAL